MTIRQLEILLDEQKRLVIDCLAGQSANYNTESTAGSYKSLPIDREKFKEAGMAARYPDDLRVLKQYIKHEDGK